MAAWISATQLARSLCSLVNVLAYWDCCIVIRTRSMPAAAQPFPGRTGNQRE